MSHTLEPYWFFTQTYQNYGLTWHEKYWVFRKYLASFDRSERQMAERELKKRISYAMNPNLWPDVEDEFDFDNYDWAFIKTEWPRSEAGILLDKMEFNQWLYDSGIIR